MPRRSPLTAALVVLAGTAAAQSGQTPPVGDHTPAMLSGIARWLVADFDMPAIQDPPQVKLVPPAAMISIRLGASRPDPTLQVENADGGGASPEAEHDTVALYDDATRTIYLPEGWTGAMPAEVSVLVHEMVHHLQNMGGLKYECAEARERPAFIAQARWLERFDQTLESAFSIDPTTLLVRTTCPR